MNNEMLDLIQKQIKELVIDIQIHRSKKVICDYDLSKKGEYCEEGEFMYVFILGRSSQFLKYGVDAEWHLSFNENFDRKLANDCLHSLACVLADLEAGK